MNANEELSAKLRHIIPTKLSLLADLPAALVGLGLAYFLYFLLKDRTFAFWSYGIGIVGLVRFAERLRFRSSLLSVMKLANGGPGSPLTKCT